MRLKLARIGSLNRVRLQFFQADEFQRRRVSCLEIDLSGETAFQGRLPASDTNTPFVAGLDSWETILGSGRDQVVSIEDGEIEKILIDQNANRVQADIFRSRSAITIAIESGQRIPATALQF